ncbi:PCYCGC motif-containing (lipo)protein [Virgibacillus kimchii]
MACSNAEETVTENPSQIDDSLEGLAYNMEKGAWSPIMAQLLNEVDDLRVQGAYEMAMEHPEVLDYMPCYCGCYESNGHEHVRHCFVESYNDNIAALDNMGFGCAICIETVEEAMAKYDEGESLPEIRDYIDQKYTGSSVGPTPTPIPKG